MRENKACSYYLLFRSIHDVLRAEKKLKERGFKFELMPIPRNLSSDCGSCIRLYDDIDEVLAGTNDLGLQGCFRYDGREFEPVVLQ